MHSLLTPTSQKKWQAQSGSGAENQERVQPALIGSENDTAEQEADAVAGKAMQFNPHGNSTGISTIQTKQEPVSVIQRKATPMSTSNAVASQGTMETLGTMAGKGQNLPGEMQQRMEAATGNSFGSTSVHTGPEANRMNQEMNAKAFTYGNDIYFREGQYNPQTAEGQNLLAHEMVHTVQQQGSKSIQRKIYMIQVEKDPNLPENFWGTASGKLDLMTDDQVNSLTALLYNTEDNPFKAAFKEQITAKDSEGNDLEYEFMLGDTDADRQKFRTDLLKEIIDNIHAVSNMMAYSNAIDLITEVRKRFTIVMDMRVTQGKSGSNKPTGYPTKDSKGMPKPRVNEATKKYWNVHAPNETKQGEPYHFTLNEEGKNNAYEALYNLLFIHQTSSSLRSLMHCDYMIAAIQYKVMADTMGKDKFNTSVADGSIVIDLTPDAYRNITVRPPDNDWSKLTAEDWNKGSLVQAFLQSENDLIIGDHVIFYNHPAYNDMNIKYNESWRLENAIITGGSPGNHMFQGHGYFSPKTKGGFVTDMVNKFNYLVDRAYEAIAAPESDPNKKLIMRNFTDETTGFNALRYSSSEKKWKIHYHTKSFIKGTPPYDGEEATMDLRKLTAADFPNPFRRPGEEFISVYRPKEML